ncbi:MAG: N-acetyl-gamma-glutamyl-phosphate reductase [Acidimicrobiales bacterium]
MSGAATVKATGPGTATARQAPATVGILGASGYAGGELLRLCLGHPGMEVAVVGAGRLAGEPIAGTHPHLAPAVGERCFDTSDPELLDGCELVFLALPHMVAAGLVPGLLGRVPHVVDLSADFRLADAGAYPRWYGATHPAPELLGRAVCGLPELERSRLPGAELVAVPGCYVTAAALALAPLVSGGVVEDRGVVVDAASGVSGAGRDPSPATSFCAADGDFSAYGLLDHRHTPEMEQVIGAQLLFTPHLAPMSRGILATCYARPTGPTSSGDLLETLAKAYAGEQFVHVSQRPPSTKATLGSCSAHLSARHDLRTGWVLSLCALDNLGKGAAGQALQCANAVLGIPEETGLSAAGVAP